MAFKPNLSKLKRWNIVQNIEPLCNMNGTFETGTLFVVVSASTLAPKVDLIDNYGNCINSVEMKLLEKVYR